MTYKVTQWELERKLDEILESNIRIIPYEGEEVDYNSLKEDILILIKELYVTNGSI